MEEEVSRIRPDMDVCDLSGQKIGTVAHVHRPALAPTGGAGAGLPPREEIIEVKSGFLGLGKHLYIPRSAFRDVVGDCAFLAEDRQALEDTEWHGWAGKPAYLDEER